eukprot:scaffold23542_cov242-Isochrysis_galbana.AAC.4
MTQGAGSTAGSGSVAGMASPRGGGGGVSNTAGSSGGSDGGGGGTVGGGAETARMPAANSAAVICCQGAAGTSKERSSPRGRGGACTEYGSVAKCSRLDGVGDAREEGLDEADVRRSGYPAGVRVENQVSRLLWVSPKVDAGGRALGHLGRGVEEERVSAAAEHAYVRDARRFTVEAGERGVDGDGVEKGEPPEGRGQPGEGEAGADAVLQGAVVGAFSNAVLAVHVGGRSCDGAQQVVARQYGAHARRRVKEFTCSVAVQPSHGHPGGAGHVEIFVECLRRVRFGGEQVRLLEPGEVIGEHNRVALSAADVLGAGIQYVEADVLAGGARPGSGMSRWQTMRFAPFAGVAREAGETIKLFLPGLRRVARGGGEVA